MSENNGFEGRDIFLFTQMKLHYHRFCEATDRLCKHVVLLLSNYQFWLGLNIFFGKCEKKFSLEVLERVDRVTVKTTKDCKDN